MSDSTFVERLNLACESRRVAMPRGRGRQRWIQERVGVSREAVSKWFSGASRPRPAVMRRLAEVLRVDEAWLALGVDAHLSPQEVDIRNARASGATNVFRGLLQLNGGSCALPSEDNGPGVASFFSIKEGVQTSYYVALAHRSGRGQDDGWSVALPHGYSACQVIVAIHVAPMHVDFIRMAHDLILRHGDERAGHTHVDIKPAGEGRYASGEDVWETITELG